MTSVFSWQNCQPLPCFILYSKAKLAYYSRYLFTSYFCIPVPCDKKDIRFYVNSRTFCRSSQNCSTSASLALVVNALGNVFCVNFNQKHLSKYLLCLTHWLYSSGQNSLCSYGFAFFLEKTDNEQVRDEECSPRNVNQGWEINSDGRGGVTFYHGWMSWVLLQRLQKVLSSC